MTAKILLVEDDLSLGETLQERLSKEGYQVDWATTLTMAQELVLKKTFDLIILDIGLPDGSGFDFARKLKESLRKILFIFMTALNSAAHRLEGYELGAEEFVPKPFHLRELLLRIKHVLEKHQFKKQLKVGTITIHFDTYTITDLEKRIVISTRDFRLLELLIERSPLVVSRDEILNQIWGADRFPSNRTVDNSIVRLRHVLNDHSGNLIRSVRGIGYQWFFEEKSHE